jgi:hypothetical protein
VTAKQRERLVARMARAIVWNDALPHQRESARNTARAIIADLLEAEAEGHAVRRAIPKLIERIEEAS